MNLENDNDNCGLCGLTCATQEDCISGFCACGEANCSCGLGYCSYGEICSEGECCSDGKCSSPMVTIPGGDFMMGCNASIDDNCHRSGNEEPYHEVNVPDFEIDVIEVTIGQYRSCVEDNSSCSEPLTIYSYCNWRYNNREDHPVNCVTWYNAKEYCEWSGKRLCSESEWEKAARGSDGRIYPWGNEEVSCDRAVMSDGGAGCGAFRTWSVASKPVGLHGLYDMAGNVWEWVEDDYHGTYDGAPNDGSAWVENPRSANRVIRGGGLTTSSSAALRASYRNDENPDNDSDGFGARCCRDAP